MEKVIDFINVNRENYLEELKGLLSIPSISALPEHADDVKHYHPFGKDNYGHEYQHAKQRTDKTIGGYIQRTFLRANPT